MSGLMSPDFVMLLTGILQDEYDLEFKFLDANRFEVSNSSGLCSGSFRKEIIYTCKDGDKVYKSKIRPTWDDIEIIKTETNVVIEVSGYQVVSYGLEEFNNYDEEFVQDLAYLLQLSASKNITINNSEEDFLSASLGDIDSDTEILFPDEV